MGTRIRGSFSTMARLLLLALFFTTACTIADAAPSRRLLEESDGATAPSCPSEVTYEVEAAVAKYKTKKPEADYQYALDEWWVFYTGSLETGATDGYGSYILAEKRSKFFGTDNAPGKCAKSMVNHKLLKASQELQTLFATQSPANDAKIDTTVTCMRGLLIV